MSAVPHRNATFGSRSATADGKHSGTSQSGSASRSGGGSAGARSGGPNCCSRPPSSSSASYSRASRNRRSGGI
eukprot:4799635-Lingulodinium_polyedra.AAC.1